MPVSMFPYSVTELCAYAALQPCVPTAQIPSVTSMRSLLSAAILPATFFPLTFLSFVLLCSMYDELLPNDFFIQNLRFLLLQTVDVRRRQPNVVEESHPASVPNTMISTTTGARPFSHYCYCTTDVLSKATVTPDKSLAQFRVLPKLL